ncbi:hybrid sensor histidine kinase/response regulator [Nannocystis sp. ILAH1]|uniref:hybrid sensor histidine kinase/response regulator n=1 Tax=Nannocystis sp. ILAH1 TaxID=2996789 RepID=UPI00226F92E7|nr:hybrid sensor histidine kinase/response regulator [Nannocystis sp. ILAH1]MCY0989150.1 hybrid sensor histidine kinase/response regulator [Nannocystis sp. ILAH1]
MNSAYNTRILIVDDEEVVRDSIRESLLPPPRKDPVLTSAAAALFGDDPAATRSDTASAELLVFEVDEAATGPEALAKVEAAIAAGRPYAVIFLDMRMPGWDGLRTAQRIRERDTRAELIFVTAYSDASLDEVIAKAGANVGYHCKPFAPEEIRQIATKGVHDWHKVRGLEALIDVIGGLRGGEREVNTLLHNILGQVVAMVGSDAALLGRTGPDGGFDPLFGVGAWQDPRRAGPVLGIVGSLTHRGPAGAVTLRDDLAIMHLESYRIAAALRETSSFDAEKIYLLELFLASAGQALENARLQERVVRTERLSALGGALAMIVHDLRTPLGNIQGLCDMIDEAVAIGRTDEVREYVPYVRESSHEAMSIVNDVLDFTREAAIERVSVRLGELGRQLRDKTRHLFTSDALKLEVLVPTDEVVSVDAPRLQRGLVNLIKNACEALAKQRTPAPRVTATLRLDGDDAVFIVADNGPGIAAELTSRLFEPFATHGKSGGTGLGLAIVQRIAESHGGTLTVASSPGGATFMVRVPRA